MALNSIDNIIDNDIKNDILNFNPDLNDQLRVKLNNQRFVSIPRNESKLKSLLDCLVECRERKNEQKKLMEEEGLYVIR